MFRSGREESHRNFRLPFPHRSYHHSAEKVQQEQVRGREREPVPVSTRAKADETVHTALFDFTCGQAEVIDSYNGIDIPEGDKLVQFHISVTNTSDSGFLIFKDDFQLQWGDGDSDFGVGFDAVDDDMLPEVTGVSPGSTLEGNILVAVPQDTTTLTVAYQETYEDGSDADAYFVDLSL